MRLLHWDTDAATLYWAIRAPVKMSRTPRPQYPGEKTNLLVRTALERTTSARFPPSCMADDGFHVRCSPENIIRCCRRGQYLEALAMVVAWGGLGRTGNYIYRARLPKIRDVLAQAASSVRSEASCGSAWAMLTTGLGWSKVTASKFLHFAVRAEGFEANPPVPVDGRVFVKAVWPAWKNEIQSHRRRGGGSSGPPLPRGWNSSDWEAYCRYMTAITVWAALRGWTTTQVENTLYRDYE